ncbi:MAG: T9SS type A sorting domain-containing protein [Flavobacteriales bacterium]|nr:T9SS type A sorting domain-containing protein [Flavobacteriales bacterium]
MTFSLAGLLSAGAMAQYPYTIALSGTVTNCYQGQVVTVQTIQGTLPQQSFTVALDSNTCSYSVFVSVSNQPAWLEVTTLCGGMMQYGSDSSQFNFVGDTMTSVIDLLCGGGTYDCLQILNGPDMPGTPCDDGNPMTWGDLWTPACVCIGADSSNTVDCLGDLGGSALPGTFCVWNNQPGLWSMGCICVPDSGNVFDCLGVVNGQNMPGTYCVNFFGDTGVWSANCVCETNSGTFDCLGELNGPAQPGTACTVPGTILLGTWSFNCICVADTNIVYDCNGLPNGPALPGTACDDNDPLTWSDTWSVACICAGLDSTIFNDCLGVLNGPAMPGTPCNVVGPDSSYWVTGTWSWGCTCYGDTTLYTDCLGVPGGAAQPGTPCEDNDPETFGETWTSNCSCEGGTIIQPCQANFWVLQAFGSDSLPIPYELWVWNLSSGGSGVFTYIWSFGDGTSSTDPYPTHTYSGNGPYVLCLTIADNSGCTSVHCDSISIDTNGMYGGVLGGEGDRTDGFTINVQNPSANSVNELDANNDIVAWPNPTAGELNIAMTNNMSGNVEVTITDLNGRVVLNEARRLINGKNQLRLSTENLGAGMYMVRIGNGTENVSVRFVKAN